MAVTSCSVWVIGRKGCTLRKRYHCTAFFTGKFVYLLLQKLGKGTIVRWGIGRQTAADQLGIQRGKNCQHALGAGTAGIQSQLMAAMHYKCSNYRCQQNRHHDQQPRALGGAAESCKFCAGSTLPDVVSSPAGVVSGRSLL